MSQKGFNVNGILPMEASFFFASLLTNFGRVHPQKKLTESHKTSPFVKMVEKHSSVPLIFFQQIQFEMLMTVLLPF